MNKLYSRPATQPSANERQRICGFAPPPHDGFALSKRFIKQE